MSRKSTEQKEEVRGEKMAGVGRRDATARRLQEGTEVLYQARGTGGGAATNQTGQGKEELSRDGDG